MWQRLTLGNFKSFREADIPLGPFTVIVGTNASGKSNIRDAFRFLHGVGRTYRLGDVVGGKFTDGERVWHGIRGGAKEIAFAGQEAFGLAAQFQMHGRDGQPHQLAYRLVVQSNGSGLRVQQDSLLDGTETIYDTHPNGRPAAGYDPNYIGAGRPVGPHGGFHIEKYSSSSAVLNQTSIPLRFDEDASFFRDNVEAYFRSVRFFDLNPEAMRRATDPGQTELGDQGENLSSVLKAICEDQAKKAAMLEWVKELTPMDAVDFRFPEDHEGKVVVRLVEADGRQISVASASDGTLRLLALAAALLGPHPARVYFFEELENGIHPTRLHLLLQLIEKTVRTKKMTQVIATTHSPDLLGLLSESARDHALLVYRLPHHADSKVKRIVDLPGAREIMAKQSAGRLHASGWLEDAVAFTEGGDP